MKKLLSSILIGGAMFIVGCKTTEQCFVDFEECRKYGIVVTNFVNNPIVATIKYDYSSIKDFNVSNLEVKLMHIIVPLELMNDPDADLSMYTKWQVKMQRYMNESFTIDNIPLTDIPNRDALIKESVPGMLKIYCFDDFGVYQIKYKK